MSSLIKKNQDLSTQMILFILFYFKVVLFYFYFSNFGKERQTCPHLETSTIPYSGATH